MKQLYSVILLFSFLVGIFQPVLPMIEYQLHEGNVIELLDEGPCEGIHSGKMFCCAIDKDCTDRENNPDQSLLDMDYYPLALQITAVPSPEIFPNSSRLHLPLIDDAGSPTFLPLSPPPRLS